MSGISAPAKGWADLLADGRLPRFALICLGVWLNAADSLVTATIMPSVGLQLGGYAYFSWATAGFFVGAILAGARAGPGPGLVGPRGATSAARPGMAAHWLLLTWCAGSACRRRWWARACWCWAWCCGSTPGRGCGCCPTGRGT